jgi:hypothetical protein
MSDIATRLRQCAADIRRTPVRLDTWIPLQQEAADTIDALRAEVDAFREDAANYYRIAKEADAQQAALRARVSELEAAGRAVLNCNDQVCAFGHGGCPAQCRADEMLRKAIRCAGNKRDSRE